MSRAVQSFPKTGKLTAVEPLLEELLDGRVHEFVRGEDWPESEAPRQIQSRLAGLGRRYGFKVKTAVRGDSLYAQVVAEADE